MAVVGFTRETEALSRQNRDALAALFHEYRPPDAQISAPAAVLPDARLPQQIHKRQAAAIQDGHFQVVDLHEGIVDAHAVKHAEQMLGGRDQHALTHQAGGVAYARHMPPACRDREAVQIGALENNAGRNRCRENSDGNWNTAMQADTRGRYGALDGRLKSQKGSPD